MLGPIDFWSWGDTGTAVRARATDASAPAYRCTFDTEEDDEMTTIDGQPVLRKRLFPNNAELVKVYLEAFDPTSNDYAAWDDASSPQYAFCSDRLGATVISGMGPTALAVVDATNYPGWFYAIVPTSVMALLDTDTYRGTTVYLRVTAGAASELRVVTPCLVADPRFAEAA